MCPMWSYLLAALVVNIPVVAQAPVGTVRPGVTHALQPPRPSQDPTAERETRVAHLRAMAKEHIDQERALYSDLELQDIESRYRSAHHDVPVRLLRRDASPVLREPVARYPRSHRSGCAVLDLAQLASGDERERYLKEAVANYSGAWCESGVQVGALARARLAIHYGMLHRFDEAERLCEELSALFPDAIDPSGAPLADVVTGIKLLKG